MPSRSFFASAQKLQQRQPARADRRVVPFQSVDQSAQRAEFALTEAPLLTTEQVRQKLGLGSINAVYRLVRDYDLPRLTIGGVYRFSQPQVEAWIARQGEYQMQSWAGR